MLIRTPEPEPAVAERKERTIRQIRDGVAVVFDDRLLRALVGTSAIHNQSAQWIITLSAPLADMTAERSESQRPRSSGASSHPDRGGTH